MVRESRKYSPRPRSAAKACAVLALVAMEPPVSLEAEAIREVVRRLAMARPDIAFTLAGEERAPVTWAAALPNAYGGISRFTAAGDFDHDADGRGPGARAAKFGYDWSLVCENIA